ncbi:MAG: sigma-70 family RNA polymerase sigma factor [Myxococcales bacterium]|nr:sigma-70 family RNA polymerase sigma factor [Myxococcales bacterium]
MSVEQVVKQHEKLVYHIVNRVKLATGVDADDEELIQYGMQGLIEAARRYDPSRGTTFSTFAWYRIQGEIYNGIRAISDEQFRCNLALRAGAAVNEHLENSAERLQQHAQSATLDPIAEMETVLDQVTTINFVALEAIQNTIADDGPSPQEQSERSEMREYLQAALETLDPELRNVVELHHFKNLNYREIGELTGKSKAWICRLYRRALVQIRKRLRALLEAGGGP